jgi:tRNA-Thr(GGU) m(6)t(6)A37 methyltransferase TsaA
MRRVQTAADPEDQRVPGGSPEEEGGGQGAPARVLAPPYLLRPIGHVVKVEEYDISEIEVLPEFEQGLFRIEQMAELDVIFVFDRSEGYDMLVHPRGDRANPRMGVFCTRSPRRPNPVGLSRVRLLERKGRSLRVQGLGVFLGTPVLDIKGAPVKGFDWKATDRAEGA